MDINKVTKRILTYAKIDSVTGCWNWSGAKNQRGYGQINIDKKYWLVHRAAYTVFVGPIPAGKIACHICDNPSCCNPSHIFIGTHKDNSQDCLAKGRHRWQKEQDKETNHGLQKGRW